MVEEWSVSKYNFELLGGNFSGVREQHSNTACRRPPDCYIFLLEITPYKHIKYVSKGIFMMGLLCCALDEVTSLCFYGIRVMETK